MDIKTPSSKSTSISPPLNIQRIPKLTVQSNNTNKNTTIATSNHSKSSSNSKEKQIPHSHQKPNQNQMHRRNRHSFTNHSQNADNYQIINDFDHHYRQPMFNNNEHRHSTVHMSGRMLEESTYAQALRGSKQPTHSIFVKNLPRDCSKQELKHAFEKYGDIYSCAVVKRNNHRHTQTHAHSNEKAFGFVNFVTKEAQDNAVRETGDVLIRDNSIECEVSTTTTVIYIGNIPVDTPDDTVRYHVRKFGGPYQALDVRHGHCFVIYNSYYKAEKAIQKLQNTKIDDETIWVSVASETKAKMLAGYCERPQSRTLHISGIGNISEHELKSYFKSYGRVLGVRIPRDLQTRINKGYAFVEFDNSGDAELAKRAEDGKSFSSTDSMNISWCHGDGSRSRMSHGRGTVHRRYSRHDHMRGQFVSNEQMHPQYHQYMQMTPVPAHEMTGVPFYGGGGGGFVDDHRPSRHGYRRSFQPPLQMELPGQPGKYVPVIPVSQFMNQQSTFFQIPPISRGPSFSIPHSIRMSDSHEHYHHQMQHRHRHRHRSSIHYSRHSHHRKQMMNVVKHEMSVYSHSRSRSRKHRSHRSHRHKRYSDRGFFPHSIKHRNRRSDRKRAVSEGLNVNKNESDDNIERKSCTSSLNSERTDSQSSVKSLSSTKSQSHHSLSLRNRSRSGSCTGSSVTPLVSRSTVVTSLVDEKDEKNVEEKDMSVGDEKSAVDVDMKDDGNEINVDKDCDVSDELVVHSENIEKVVEENINIKIET